MSYMYGKNNYLFTWNLVHPSLKNALICLAAAIPALIFASAVCAPIFLGVEKVSTLELGKVCISIRLDISDELQVLTLSKKFQELRLIDNLLTLY